MRNSSDQGGCYPQRPKNKVDNTLTDLQNSSYPTKVEFNDCFIFIQNISPFSKEFRHFALCFSAHQKSNTISSPDFLGLSFNNLRQAALLKALIQYDKDSFQVWSTAAGHGELCVWF